MGNVLFRRKKIVAEELEELQQLSNELDDQIQHSLEQKYTVKWFVSILLLLVMGSTVASALFTVQDRNRRAAYSAFSFIAGSALIYCIQMLISVFYDWSIKRKRKARYEITQKKVAILEKVKETETFKVAEEILTKYDETRRPPALTHPKLQAQHVLPTAKEVTGSKSMEFSFSGDKQRNQANGQQPTTGTPGENPSHPRTAFPRPPRPFFKQRSVTEKFVDYILGDGANHRYALICAHCNEHNGMAREEDFDYISYRCWVCGEFNQARKQRARVNSAQIRPFNAQPPEEIAPTSTILPASSLQKADVEEEE